MEDLKNYMMDKGAFYQNLGKCFYKDCGTDLANRLGIACKNADWSTIANAKLDIKSYLTHHGFFTDLATRDFFRKTEDLPTGLDKRVAAYSAFTLAEAQCANTNEKFSDGAVHAGYENILHVARLKIGALLHDFSWSRALRGCRHGNGSTYSIKLEEAGIDTKYDESRLTCTSEQVDLIMPFMNLPAWQVARGYGVFHPSLMNLRLIEARLVVVSRRPQMSDIWPKVSTRTTELEVIRGDKISFVPKNAKTERTVTPGPTAGVFLSLGLGAYLRTCLLRCGLDLTDQTVNQRASIAASLSGLDATIDLTSASDTNATNFVRELMPEGVFRLMDKIRSKEYEVVGVKGVKRQWLKYHKFSGMGNGFTFPLQTMMYWALAVSVCEEHGLDSARVKVYGDDMIVPVEAYNRLIEVLEYCGFTPNVDKSFASGHYRESCGSQAFMGYNCPPPRWNGFEADITPWEIARMAHQLVKHEERVRLTGGVLRYRRTLSFLRRFYTFLCKSGDFGHAASRNPPIAHPDWEPGEGFPDYSTPERPHVKYIWVFVPLKRDGRDAAVYASHLQSMQRRGYLRIPIDSSWLSPIKAISCRGLPCNLLLPYEGTLTVPKSGHYKITRRKCYPLIG